MIESGKKKLGNYKNINWLIGSAENLPVKSNYFDYYSISFGVYNVYGINSSDWNDSAKR